MDLRQLNMRDFSRAKRIVVKIGTNVLTKNGGLDTAYIARIARQMNELLDEGRQLVIVSSGAIGMGAGQLELGGKIKDMKMRQACAAIGQPLLMAEYRKSFGRFGVQVAQVLVTAEVLDNRRTYLNLRNSIEKLLRLGVVPVLNENDSVSTDEIGTSFGDNDKLCALVASKIDADLLIMLSDIDALYDKDPRKSREARRLSAVDEITDAIQRSAGGKGSLYGTGGMKSKIEAAQIASNAGCRLVLANGRSRNIIPRIMGGQDIGTVFLPKRKLSNRARWILNSQPAGMIEIDSGAMKAVRNHKSLLPSGIVRVSGTFKSGSVVMLNEGAKAVTALGSSELRMVAGKHSKEIKRKLGKNYREEIALPEDIVFLDY